MAFVQFTEAARLSGLSCHQLREWCGRRGLVRPDVPAAGRGRHALFSWHTLLTLRVLNELHVRFGVELSAWRGAVEQCQIALQSQSFPGLANASIEFINSGNARLLRDAALASTESRLTIPLSTHLNALIELGAGQVDHQLPLFKAIAVKR